MSASGEPSPSLPSPPLSFPPLPSPSLSLPSPPLPSPPLSSVLQGCVDSLARYQNEQLSLTGLLGLFSGLFGMSSTNSATQPLPFPSPSLPLTVPLPPPSSSPFPHLPPFHLLTWLALPHGVTCMPVCCRCVPLNTPLHNWPPHTQVHTTCVP